MQIAIEVYRRALRIADTLQDAAITDTANRVEADVLNYLGFPSFAEFYYEYGEDSTTYLPFESACVGAVVTKFDDPTAETITDAVRACLRPFRPTKVG